MGFHGKQIQPGTIDLDRLYTTGYTPSAASDLTTVEYVQALGQGLFPKAEVRVRPVGNVNIALPSPVYDGVTMVLGDRMILADQINQIENGIYTYAPTGLIRATDADDPGDLKMGSFVYVQEGTTWAGFSFFITGIPSTPPNIDIGIDPIVWSPLQRQLAPTVENGLTMIGNVIRLGGPLAFDTDIDGGGLSNMSLSNLTNFEISTPGRKYLFDKGGSVFRIENAGATEVYMDLKADWRFNIGMNDGGGAGQVNASYSVNLAANGIVNDTNTVNAAANTTFAVGAKYGFASGRNHLIGDGVGSRGDSSAAFGIDTINNGQASITSGVGAQILNVANQRGGIAHGFSTGSGLKPVGVPYVTASSGAVNISRNTVAQTAGFGALAQDSIILGGYDHHIPADSPGSVILGGATIVARATDPNQVYLPNLNIMIQPINDDTLGEVLVRDSATGQIKYRAVSSIVGDVNVANGLSTDSGNVVLGGLLDVITNIDIDAYGFELESADAAGYIDFSLTDGITASNYSQAYNSASFQISDTSNAFTLTMTPLGGVIAVGGANPGLQYALDYSAYFTDRSLVDKEYVDNAVSGGSFSLTNGNGTTANGTAVDLGGALTANATITGAFNVAWSALTNFTVQADIAGGRNARFGLNDGGGYAYLRNDDAGFTQSGQVKVGIDYVTFYASTNPNNVTVEIHPTSMTIGGTGTFGGAQYVADYSANYTDRSLVDKEYVDNAITAAGSYWPLTGTGTLLGNVFIDGTNNYNVVMGGLTLLQVQAFDANVEGASMQVVGGPSGNFTAQSLSFVTGKVAALALDNGGVLVTSTYDISKPSTTLQIVNGQMNFNDADAYNFNNTSTSAGVNYQTYFSVAQASGTAFAVNANITDSANDNLTDNLTTNWGANSGFQMYRQRYSDIAPDSIYAMFSMNIDDASMGIYEQSPTGSNAFVGVTNTAPNADYTPFASVGDNNNNGVKTTFRLSRVASGTGTTNPNAVGVGGRLDYELLIGPIQQVVTGAIDNIATAVGAGWETKFVLHVGDTGVLTPVMEIDKYGAKHAADYSANYTARSLVDKDYVDNAIITAGGNFWPLTGSATLTGVVSIDGDSAAYGVTLSDLSNFQVITEVGGILLLSNDGGMQLINPSGTGGFQIYHGATAAFNINTGNSATNFYMGHAGTGNMTIQNTGGGDMRIQNNGSAGNLVIENTQGTFDITNNAFTAFTIQNNGDGMSLVNNGPSGFGISSTGGDLSLTNNGENLLIEHNGNGSMTITDGRATPVGIEYAADYSANYTNRSLVDKEYVDNAVSGGVTASNGLTETGGNITLGGALTANTTISGAFNLNFANGSVTISAAALPSTLNFGDGTITSTITHIVGGRLEISAPIGYLFNQGGVERMRIAAGGDKHVVINLPQDESSGLVTYSSGTANIVSPEFAAIGFPSNTLSRAGAIMYSSGSNNLGLVILPTSAASTANLLSVSNNDVTNYDGYMATISYALTSGALTGGTSKPMLRIIKSVASDGGFDHTGAFIEMLNDTELTGDYIKAWDGTVTHFRIKSNGDQYFSSRVIDYATPFDGLITTYNIASLHYSSVALMKYDGSSDYATGSAIYIDRTYTNVGGQPVIHTIRIEQNMDNDVAINAGALNQPLYMVASSVDIPTHAGHFEASLTKNNPTSTPIAVYAKATVVGTGTAYSFYGDDGILYNDGNVVVTQSIIAGTSSAPAGSLTYTFGDGNVNRGVFGSAMFGELSEIDINVGSAFNAGENNYISAYGGHTMGRGVKVSGVYSWAGGWYSPTSASGKTNLKAVLVSGDGSFGFFETNGSQTDGHGVLAASSAVLAGVNPNIPVDSPRSVILGGNGIKARAAAPDQVYVPNFNIVVPPANDDALTQILARDGVTGEIKYRTAASLGGGGSIPAPQEDDRDMVPAVTTGDNQPTGLTITNTPTGLIIIALNGEIKSLGNGVKTKHCYFSGDGGVTARAYSAIVATDELYWNGVIAGYDLDAADVIDFYYI